MRRLPSSPSRQQALNEFEPLLLARFQNLSRHVNHEVRDAMHYTLFSAEDRFGVSAAWLVAPRLGVKPEKFAATACALETLRCSLDFKIRDFKQRSSGQRPVGNPAIEPALAEAAAYGLIPLAFEMVLTDEAPLLENERIQLAATLARAASPMHVLSALHREGRIVREGFSRALSARDLFELHQEKVTPAFQAAGESLALLSGRPSPALADWFRKLGLFAHWVHDFEHPTRSPLALASIMSLPEAMDVIKSAEAELFERAKALDIQGAAHEIIEPLADVLKTQLQ